MAITDSGLGLQYGAGSFYTNVIRDHFLAEVADGINHDYVLLNRFDGMAEAMPIEGNSFVVFPVHSGRANGSVGAVGYSGGTRGKLPDPRAQQYLQYRAPIRSVYGRVLIDGLADDATQTDIDSWLRALDSEMAGLRDDLARAEQRMLHNDGSGVVAQTASFGDTTSTLILNQNIASPTTATGMDPTYWIDVDATNGVRYLALQTAALTTTPKEVLVTAKTTTTITYGAAGASADARVFVVANTGTTASPAGAESSGIQREPMGIAGIFNSTNVQNGAVTVAGAYFESSLANTFQGIAVSGNTFNQANVLSNSNVARLLTEQLMQQAFSRTQKVLGGRPSVAITSFGVRDSFVDQLLTYRRQVNTMKMAAGFEDAPTYNGVPIIADRDCYPNRLYLMDESEFRQPIMGSKTYRLRDEMGTMFLSLPDEHAYQICLYRRFTYIVGTRAKQTIITDISEYAT